MSERSDTARDDHAARFNPGGIVYGVLAVATVIAAESTRRETFPKLLWASLLTLVLYWLAHAYAHHWGSHLQRPGDWSLTEIGRSAAHEASILLGAVGPVAALLLVWALGGSRETAVTAVLWTAGSEIVGLELVAGLVRHSRVRDLAVQVLMGLSMGLGLLAVRVLLH
ncbi:MAG: hypothetical protein KGQ66_08320 [Acidobacteriota bacterium]|nr:hypothetical protein [Acidobacteriota bacterium]